MEIISLLSALCLASCMVLSNCETAVDPYSKGPHEVNYTTFLSSETGIEDINVTVWSPLEKGKYKVLFFPDGFGMGTVPLAYSDFVSFIASHGFVVVAPLLTVKVQKQSEKVPYFKALLKWSEDNLQEFLHESCVPDDVLLDMNTSFAMSHSAGGHVLVSFLKQSCWNFKGLILMSPVDGADPLGIVNDWCITPGQKLNFDIPTLHMYGGYDPVVGTFGVACAPANMSNERFWNALNSTSQRWSINATDFGHADIMDFDYRVLVDESHFCGSEAGLSILAYNKYRRFVGGTAVSFINALLMDNYQDYQQYLENTDLMPIVAKERHVNPTGKRPTPMCEWTPVASEAPEML